MRRSLPCLIVLAVLAFGSRARAADPLNEKEAQRLFAQSLQLLHSGHPDEARVKLSQANALVRSTDILWNLILVEEQSKHYVDAVNHSYQLLRDPKAKNENLTYLREALLREALPHVGLIEIEAPAGALIEIDSKDKAGHAPLLDPFAVVPGAHQVVAFYGGTQLTKDVLLVAGQKTKVSLGIEPEPAPVAAPTPAPPAPSPLPDPRPSMEGPSSPPAVDLDTSDSERRKTRFYVAGTFAVAAVALAATSAVFFGLASSSNNDVSSAGARNPQCPSTGCADLSSALDRERGQAIAAYAFAGGAGLAVVGAGLSWVLLTPHHRTPQTGLQIFPTFTPEQTGLVLRGRF
jgi:hypothetical protein